MLSDCSAPYLCLILVPNLILVPRLLLGTVERVVVFLGFLLISKKRAMIMLWTFSFLSFQLYQMFSNILDYLPGPHNNIFKEFDSLKAFVSEEVKIHQASLDPTSPQDFIDLFLNKMQEVRRP